MATGNSLPPQAYTRETLTAAFNWLQSQPDSVRKAATSPDTLVALYTRAQRFGSSTLESDAPVSSQAFMSDLKNLAEGLKQFEEPRERFEQGRRPSAAFASNTQAAFSPGVQAAYVGNAPHSAPNSAHGSHQGPLAPHAYHAQVNPNASAAPPPSAPLYTPPPTAAQSLNERSFAMVQEVRSQFNLSSDAEAMNLMLALAYKSLRNLLA